MLFIVNATLGFIGLVVIIASAVLIKKYDLVTSLLVNVCFGLFAFFSLVISSLVLKKYELPWFAMLMAALGALCLTLAEFSRVVRADEGLYVNFFATGMFILFLISLVKFYDIMRLTQ